MYAGGVPPVGLGLVVLHYTVSTHDDEVTVQFVLLP